jgi:hypothetical protein
MIQCVPVCCNSVPNPWGARPSGRTAGPTNRRPDQPQTVAGRGGTPLLLSNPSVCHFKPHPERKVPHTDRRTAQKVLFVPLRAGRAVVDPRLRHWPDVFDRKRRGALGGRPPTAGGRGKEDEQRWNAGHAFTKKWAGISAPKSAGRNPSSILPARTIPPTNRVEKCTTHPNHDGGIPPGSVDGPVPILDIHGRSVFR